MRFLLPLLFSLSAAVSAAHAQEDSVFKDYGDYAAFVDQHVMTRDFVPLILRLGGRDEYSTEELNDNNTKLRRVWPRDFDQVSVFRHEDLGGGISQEGRVYWTGTGYAYFYAMLHDRPDGFVVISFHLNSNSKKVMERF